VVGVLGSTLVVTLLDVAHDTETWLLDPKSGAARARLEMGRIPVLLKTRSTNACPPGATYDMAGDGVIVADSVAAVTRSCTGSVADAPSILLHCVQRTQGHTGQMTAPWLGSDQLMPGDYSQHTR
jgi:hypothetical protein